MSALPDTSPRRAPRAVPVNGQGPEDPAERFRRQTRFAWVPVGAMFTAPYERPLSQAKVDRILSHWDLRAVGCLYLAQREHAELTDIASFAILDGRHRQAAAEQKGIEALPALIYLGLTYAEEAELYVAFATVNQQTSLDRFRARLEAADPTALRIKELVETETPLKLPLGMRFGGSGYLNAVHALERIYDQFGAALLTETFRLVREIWGNSERAWHANVLHGLSQFLARYQTYEHYDRARLVERAQMVTPETLIGRAHMVAAGAARQQSNTAVGLALWDLYNDGLRSGKLPPWATRVYARTPEGEVISLSLDQ